MSRGYLKTVGDRKRLRLVKAGYDANSESVPFDAVLFDSDSDGMGSVLETGQAIIPASGTFAAATTGMWLRTWSYGFTPLCIFSFNAYNNAATQMWDHSQWARFSAFDSVIITQPRITVSNAGIWLRGGFGKASGVNFTVSWTAFRVSAT